MNLTRCAALALRQTMLNILTNILTAEFVHCAAPVTVCVRREHQGTKSYLPISPLSRETPVVFQVGEIASHTACKLLRSPSSLSWIPLRWIHLGLGDELTLLLHSLSHLCHVKALPAHSKKITTKKT